MDRADIDRWLGAYVEAWKSYDRDRIRDLFAEDVEYRYYPHEEAIRGRDAVTDSWFEEDRLDEPGTYDGVYETVAVDGDVAVATGASTYVDADGAPKEAYDNCFVMRFDGDGRCAEFTEYFVKRPG